MSEKSKKTENEKGESAENEAKDGASIGDIEPETLAGKITSGEKLAGNVSTAPPDNEEHGGAPNQINEKAVNIIEAIFVRGCRIIEPSVSAENLAFDETDRKVANDLYDVIQKDFVRPLIGRIGESKYAALLGGIGYLATPRILTVLAVRYGFGVEPEKETENAKSK